MLKRTVLRTSIAIIGMAFFMGLTPSIHADHVKVILLGGQSNMDGRGGSGGLPQALKSPQNDVRFYYRGNPSLTTLRPGSGDDFGPEVQFGRNVADEFSSDNFALIKHAVGGTDLDTDWAPNNGGTYNAFRNTVNAGLTALTDAGHTYEIVGMLWAQGETDAKDGRTTAQYEADLNAFIGDIRTRYGEDLPFFLSRLSSGQTDVPANGLTQIRAAQNNVAANDSNAYLIDTDGFGLKDDDLHFNAAGQVELGEAFGNTFINAINVPEPASMLVFGVVGAFVMARRR
ncbi:MAG: sialate O-acetylesterase [Planctomycetota bacterium]